MRGPAISDCRARARKVWARLRVDVATSGPASGVPQLPPPWRQSPCGEISTHAPNLADGVHGSTTAGAGSSPPSSIGTPSVSAGMSQARRPLRRRQPISMGLAGLYGSTAAGAARALALRSVDDQVNLQRRRRQIIHVGGAGELYNAQWIVGARLVSPAQARRRGTPRSQSGPVSKEPGALQQDKRLRDRRSTSWS